MWHPDAYDNNNELKTCFEELVVRVLLCRRGSPLVIGVKSATKLATDRFPVIYSKGDD